MKLYFRCPDHNREFATEEYTLTENRGIVVADTGQKVLDAVVTLQSPCPWCGKQHRFTVAEVGCPLTREDND